VHSLRTGATSFGRWTSRYIFCRSFHVVHVKQTGCRVSSCSCNPFRLKIGQTMIWSSCSAMLLCLALLGRMLKAILWGDEAYLLLFYGMPCMGFLSQAPWRCTTCIRICRSILLNGTIIKVPTCIGASERYHVFPANQLVLLLRYRKLILHPSNARMGSLPRSSCL
jgi:hypothetical protein